MHVRSMELQSIGKAVMRLTTSRSAPLRSWGSSARTVVSFTPPPPTSFVTSFPHGAQEFLDENGQECEERHPTHAPERSGPWLDECGQGEHGDSSHDEEQCAHG